MALFFVQKSQTMLKKKKYFYLLAVFCSTQSESEAKANICISLSRKIDTLHPNFWGIIYAA